MAYQLRATRRASKELQKLPAQIQQRIREAIYELADDPRPPGRKKLRSRDDPRFGCWTVVQLEQNWIH